MDLKYLLIRWNGKRKLFILTHEEEGPLLERLYTLPRCRIIARGSWGDGEAIKRRLLRWIPRIESCIVTSEQIESDALSEVICEAYVAGVRVRDLDAFLLDVDPTVPASPGFLIRLLAKNGVYQDRRMRFYALVKYVAEPFVALAMLIVLSPILILTAFLVKLTSPGPVIYSQERIGFQKRVFKIFKFRSMLIDAEKNGPQWASASTTDPHLTPIGGFLRASHLDELPQLWNIVRGELSFIGPRPERPEFVKQLTKAFPLFRLRPLMRPGITGWAQIEQGYVNSVADSRRKLEFDLFYMIKQSPRLDALILFRTVSVLFSGGTEEIKRARTEKGVTSRA